MEHIKVLKEVINDLFDRKEIILEINSDVIPSHAKTKKLISEKLSTSQDAIKIKKIHGKFGSKNFKIEANVYNSKESKESIESKKKKEIESEKKISETVEQPKEEPKTEHGAKEETRKEIIEDIQESGVPNVRAMAEEKLDEEKQSSEENND